MKLVKLVGRTSVWSDFDAFGQLQYRVYPPCSPPTVDVNSFLSIRLDRVQAIEEAKRIDGIFHRCFNSRLDEMAKAIKRTSAYKNAGLSDGGVDID